MQKKLGVRSGLVILLGLITLFSGGCAVMQSRRTKKYRETPHYYPSTKMIFDGEHFGLGTDHSFGPESICLCGLCYITAPIELPVSVVADTLLLPLDYLNQRHSRKAIRFISNALYSDLTPTATEFMTYYNRKLCEQNQRTSIRYYLSQPLEFINPEKVHMLFEAGAFHYMITRGNYLDMALIEAFLDISRDGSNMQFIMEAARNPALPEPAFEIILERALRFRDQSSLISLLLQNPNVPSAVLLKILDTTTDNPRRTYIQDAVMKHPNMKQDAP